MTARHQHLIDSMRVWLLRAKTSTQENNAQKHINEAIELLRLLELDMLQQREKGILIEDLPEPKMKD